MPNNKKIKHMIKSVLIGMKSVLFGILFLIFAFLFCSGWVWFWGFISGGEMWGAFGIFSPAIIGFFYLVGDLVIKENK